jgi:hypothetical protein
MGNIENFSTFLSERKNGDTPSSTQSGGHHIVGGHFLLSASHTDILLSSLPPIVHIRKESDKAATRWPLERMKGEAWLAP